MSEFVPNFFSDWRRLAAIQNFFFIKNSDDFQPQFSQNSDIRILVDLDYFDQC